MISCRMAWQKEQGFQKLIQTLAHSLTSAVVPLTKYSHLNKREIQHTVTLINTPNTPQEKSDLAASSDPLQIQAELPPHCRELTEGRA